jgi:pimeloyl-ACP methyl ester carboxylesterase
MVTASVERSYRPDGIARQMHAVMTDGERANLLHRITAPTLVIHGKADPLVPYACGEDTAQRIPGARLIGIDGMGHDLPAPVVQSITDALIPFLHEHP